MGITQAGVWILLLFTLPPHQIDVLRSFLFYYMNSPSFHEVGRPKLSDLRKYKSMRGSNDARQHNEPTILCSLYCVLNSLVYCALLLLRSSFALIPITFAALEHVFLLWRFYGLTRLGLAS